MAPLFSNFPLLPLIPFFSTGTDINQAHKLIIKDIKENQLEILRIVTSRERSKFNNFCSLFRHC
jgi:hypothetical protein